MKSEDRRRLTELEAEVSALRARIESSERDSALKAELEGSALGLAQEPTSPGDRLTVDTESDMLLNSCPPFILQLLDALPVQIFLKKAELAAERGRPYTYLNKAARTILHWEEGSIVGRYDSEAFQDGAENPQWRQMTAAETQTIEGGVRTATDLQWTSPFGDEWRINRVTQLPIFNRSGLHPVGFCSIAQDIEFRQFQQTNQFFTRAVLHEYGNLCNGILSDIAHSRAYPEARERYLMQAENRAIGAKSIAATLFDAVRHLKSTETSNVAATIERVITLSRSLPINLEIDVAEETLSVVYPQPRVALAVLVQLISNAEKHSTPELRVEGRAQVWLSARPRSEGLIEWMVSNLRERLDGHLDFEDATSASLGGMILGNIVRRAYRVERADEVIKFPEALGPDKRVNVVYLTPRGAA